MTIKRNVFVDKCNEVQYYWGERMPMMVMEEAGELIQAISKYERKNGVREVSQNLIDEIGDMYISLMALQLQLNEKIEAELGDTVGNLIEKRIEEKLNKKY